MERSKNAVYCRLRAIAAAVRPRFSFGQHHRPKVKYGLVSRNQSMPTARKSSNNLVEHKSAARWQ
eukprot:scaffold506933_cov46-Prasinocladus_malaysianus.AAC.1